MEQMYIQSIAGKIGARVIQRKVNYPVLYLSTDSRTIVSGYETLFFALVTARNDGHQYIDHAYTKGVRGFVISSLDFEVEKYRDATFLLVMDTLVALQTLASTVRRAFAGDVIGITGSNGKTIVKEWMSELLADDCTTIRSPKSYNSQIGVPLSAWLMKDSADIAIIEAGISEPGEMEKLQPIIKPRVGVITNIGEAHQANFESYSQKIEEKLTLFHDSEVIVYRSDYEFIYAEVKKLAEAKNIRTFSWSMMDEQADLFVFIVQKVPEGCGIVAQSGERTYAISIPFSDDASVENALSCLATLIVLEKDHEEVLNRFSILQPVAMRLEIKQGINNCIVINDSYNSDLNSLSIALDTLEQQASEGFLTKTLILSDIYSSSKPDEVLYAEVADLVKFRGIQRFIGIGPNIKLQESQFSVDADFFSSTAEFLSQLDRSSFEQQAILLKGARAFHFDQIAAVLQQKAHETVLEIDMSAMVHNLNYFKSKLNPSTKMMAMVKAFSYGSGNAEIARLLEFHHVDYLAVAIADEGVELRKAGIALPIVVMNPEEHSFDMMLENRLEPNIYSLRLLMQFLGVARRNAVRGFPIHVKIDTGMKRLGLENENEVSQLLAMINQGKELYVSSVFTHLAASDDPAHDVFTKQQIERFENLAKLMQAGSPHPLLRHVLNSAGIERFSECQYEMVRLGIGLYGVSVINPQLLQNVSTLKTTISQIRQVKSGETIGYNRRGVALKDTTIGVLPIGYADGLNRRLSNGVGKMWVKGSMAPIIGNICMDMCMIDITGLDVHEGDRVVVFGKEHPATEMADILDTIPYEVFTSVSQRVKRIYFQE
jgi:Alr-MurF fusion protein